MSQSDSKFSQRRTIFEEFLLQLHAASLNVSRDELLQGEQSLLDPLRAFIFSSPSPFSYAKNSSTYAHLLRLERSLNVAREELLSSWTRIVFQPTSSPTLFLYQKIFKICPPPTLGEVLECGKGGAPIRWAVVAGSSYSLHLLLLLPLLWPVLLKYVHVRAPLQHAAHWDWMISL